MYITVKGAMIRMIPIKCCSPRTVVIMKLFGDLFQEITENGGQYMYVPVSIRISMNLISIWLQRTV